MSLFSSSALIGGLLIGVSAIMLLLFLGRIMGVSGIVNQLLTKEGFVLWRVLFIVGLVGSPLIYQLWRPLPDIQISSNILLLILAGLLVGVGARIAGGCTSGHSICGIARLSPSSILVTLIFMVFGGVSVFVVKHLLF